MQTFLTWAMAHRPLVATFSAYSSTLPSGKLNLFWTTAVSSLILFPFSPRTFCVLVAMMMISVLPGVVRTSTPEYPSSANSLGKNNIHDHQKTNHMLKWTLALKINFILPSQWVWIFVKKNTLNKTLKEWETKETSLMRQ